MRCIEVIGAIETMQTEVDANDAQLQSIKKQQQALKVKKAQAKANKALQQLAATRRAASAP